MQKLGRRYFSVESRIEIGDFTRSRGKIGRKIFDKGWKHLEPRYPINIQERWHRSSVERIIHPNIIDNIELKGFGNEPSLDWRLFFETTSLNNISNETKNKYSENELNEFKKISPWHDIPLGFKYTKTNELLFNYINEIPKNTRAKNECATKEEWNPIKQDTKKGELRFFKYGDMPFNYGFIPQTWEDPSHQSKYIDIPDLYGDNDPIDVVEISNNSYKCGEILPIKILNVLALIDEGETDWKIIGIKYDENDSNINNINNIFDAEQIYGIKYSEIILDWFLNYKVPDGKPQNEFAWNAEYKDSTYAINIIEETYKLWYNLMLGSCDYNMDNININSDKKMVFGDHGLNLNSITMKYLIAQGIASNIKVPELPVIEYPKLDRWRATPIARINDVDKATNEYEIKDESPDQRKI